MSDAPSQGKLHYVKDGPVARITFDNPSAFNALNERMWADMDAAAKDVAQDRDIRVVTFRGVGGKAFVSGTDISDFANFRTGADGLAYERKVSAFMVSLDHIPQTTIAIVDGWAVGGGINICSACDFRIATPSAKFGSPLGRTIGNCLSTSSYARVMAAVGMQIAKRMILLGELIPAQQLLESGFLYSIVEPSELDAAAEALVQRAAENAPITTKATKEAIRRAVFGAMPNIDDLIEEVYASDDFRAGVANFLAKNKSIVKWQGR